MLKEEIYCGSLEIVEFCVSLDLEKLAHFLKARINSLTISLYRAFK
jgi:hypothetical protein